MKYSDENLLLDYARRTRKNLEFIENTVRQQPDAELFEVTQLINSLLGLLVFPFERLRNLIPATPLSELQAQGWCIPQVMGDFPQVEDLRKLIHYLRNSVAHFNIEFRSDSAGQIEGLNVWNVRNGRRNWRASLTITDLRDLTKRFLELIEEKTAAC